MRVRMSRRGLLAGTGMSLLTTAACTTDAPGDGQTLRLGWIVPRSGMYEAIGKEMTAGLSLYFDVAGHKLGGHTIEMVALHEDAGPEGAAEAVDKQGVIALAGIGNSGSYKEIADFAQDRKIPLIGAGDRPDLNPSRLQWLWHVSWISSEPGTAMASYVQEKGVKSVYAIGPKNRVGRDQVGGFSRAFTALDGTVHGANGEPQWTDPESDDDFSQYLSEAASSGADAIYAYYVGKAAVNFVKEHAKSEASSIPLYGAFLTEGGALPEQGKSAMGVLTAMNYSSDLDNAANRAFVAEWQAVHKAPPNVFAVCGWDVGQVLDGAVKAIPGGEKVTPAGVNTALSELGAIDSPRGSWRFSESTHSPIQRWYLREVQQDGTRLANIVIEELETLGD